ncbi:restriction endonuclease subunit S [Bremerella sp. T1]|uniref:restriction endonuclease subunit S n=1 Tax=Bremerella sp. TYQ1 TaxID=3119568 RepID=UPI001CCFC862|nr:restriction endonuclease subunit S [Bremerella volcania]UBM35328.1 restriction endonuclease subunit S [Bremerella volcania]
MPPRNPEWQTYQLGDLCDICRGSSPRPIADQRFFVGGTIPWIKIADATSSGKYLYKTKQYVNELGASHSRLLPKGALIIACSGVTLGYTQMLGVKGCAHDGWLIPSNFRGIDKHFLYYFFLWKNSFFHSSSYGAAIQNINTTILKEMEVTIPSLPTQRKIASILSAYDNLIENNTRRIAILEEMAQTIYRQWFVHYRFPGHENIKLVDSPMGKIPEGWEVRRLRDLVEATRGFSYKGKHLASTGTPMHNLNSVLEGGGYKYAGIKFYDGSYKDKHIVRSGDLVVANTEQGFDRRLIGFAALIPQMFDCDCIASHHLYIVRPHEATYLTPVWLLHLFNSKGFQRAVSGYANGTTINMLPVDALSIPTLPVPPKHLVEEFSEVAMQMAKEKEVLHRKNDNLRATRDLLLPKLISGQLDVESLDIDTGELAEELEEATT